MNSRQVSSSVGIAAIALLAVAGVMVFRDGDRRPPSVGKPPPEPEFATSDVVPPAVDSPTSETTPSSPAGRHDAVPSLEEVARLCIDPWSGLDDVCAEALDRRYGIEPVGLARLHDVPGDWDRAAAPPAFEGIAWEEVFADPLGTRATAQAALRRPECRVSPLETRPDLGADCAVDAIAKLAMLQAGCVMELVYYKPGFNPWGPPDDVPVFERRAAEMDAKWWQYEALDEDVSLPVDEYYRRRAEIDDARFRFAWRLMRCKAVPEDALAWLDELPTPAAGGHQGRDLTEAAARLGSEWATRELRQSKELVEKEWREEWKRQQRESQDRRPAVPAERD